MSLPPTLELLGSTVSTYTLAVSLSILLTLGAAWYALRNVSRLDHILDTGLCALASGLLLARIEHIALHWDYFASGNLPLTEWLLPAHEGGLGWHGAVIGGLFGLWIGARLFLIESECLLAAFLPALPLIGFGAWVGCFAHGCAYGGEVDTLARYPPLVVIETRDLYGMTAPRWFTQGYGVLLAGLMSALIYRAHRRGSISPAFFWMILSIQSVGMFLIGFFRADATPRWFSLRVDQVLDLIIMGWSFVNAHRAVKRR